MINFLIFLNILIILNLLSLNSLISNLKLLYKNFFELVDFIFLN